MKQSAILAMLSSADRASVDRCTEVAAEVLANPPLFKGIVRALCSVDPLIRVRAAEAAEKITQHNPGLLQPHRKTLLRIAGIDEKEFRAHVAPLFSRISWTHAERNAVVHILQEYLKDKSSAVRISALQAMADQAAQDRKIRNGIVKQIRILAETGTPAMRNRGKKLLERLERL